MNRMTNPRLATVFACSAIALLAAACGGGGGAEEGDGPRVSDPAKVSTSTPLANAVLYTIKQDGSVSASGAASSVTVPAGPTLTGGGTSQVAQSGSYTVESNDTCAAIANSHDISVDQLLAVNRTINCNNLRIGDVLKIPASATVAATPRAGSTATGGGGGGKTYTVASGDSCSAIATANGVTVPALLAANPAINTNCTNLDIGDVLRIP